MYSLYRAWLSMSGQPASAEMSITSLPLNLSSGGAANAPDVQLQVGPSLTNFSAHRNVLSAHSGFFKAALNNCTPCSSASSSSGSAPPVGAGAAGPILVPNIAVDEFSSLLTFMYTGYLDLNLSNIYNILLATHILHMPRALELCRNFLMQTQQQQRQQLECPHPSTSTSTATATSGIIKPIASRMPLPNIEALSTPADAANTEGQSEKKVFNNSVFKIYDSSAKHDAEREKNRVGEENAPEPCTSKSSKRERPALDKRDKAPADGAEKLLKKDKKRRASGMAAQVACALPEERVIVDVACCDGPVRFHRVVNKNYGRKVGHPLAMAAPDDEPTQKKRTTLAAINKIMTENIKLANDQNANAAAKDVSQENASAQPLADLYTCLYCNHTFKSQYCYQKHARRHLNPVDAVKTAAAPPNADASDDPGNSTSIAGHTKREFKLLDMNVQYYPCKTCGSKFPSYYFVHKHRKLCHADEMADGSNKNNEIVQVKPKLKKTPNGGGAPPDGGSAMVGEENSAERPDGAQLKDAQEETTGSDIIDVEDTN